MNKKQKILNHEVVNDILNSCSNNSSLVLAPALIMQQVSEELASICMEFRKGKNYVDASALDRFAHIKPTDEQIHHALCNLLEMKKADGKQHLFMSSRQYLAIFKVLVFLGIMNTNYGCYANMEAYINTLFACHKPPRVLCNQDALSKKCIGKPYTQTLREWESMRSTKELKNYWPIAIHFLNFLRKECGTESGT